MQTISLSSIYDSISAHDNIDARSVRNRYNEALEEQPMYSKSPYNFLAWDKAQTPQNDSC